MANEERMLLNKSGADDIEEPLEGTLQDLDVVGMAWWNGLPEADRRYWCLAAMTAVPAQAWKYFRMVTAPRRAVKINHSD